MTVPTWEECVNAGMTAVEAAQARGRHPKSARDWAYRNGKSFAPAERGRPKGTTSPHLRHLSKDQHGEYRFLVDVKKFPAAEALAMVEA